MHEDEGDRLRADIVEYEQRVAELEKNLASSLANTEASLALAAHHSTAEGCGEDGETNQTPEAESVAKGQVEMGGPTPGMPLVLGLDPRAPGLNQRTPDGAVITRVKDGSLIPEEADEAKRAAVRAAVEEQRRTSVRHATPPRKLSPRTPHLLDASPTFC